MVDNFALYFGIAVQMYVEELVSDGQTGWTFYPDRADECHAAIELALTASEADLAAMRTHCRERIGELDFAAVVERMVRAVRYAQQ